MEPASRRHSELELDRRTCLTLLASATVGRIVLSGDDPFIVPVNFVVVDDLVVFRSEPTSHAARSVGTAVAFEVDTVDINHQAGWSVIARGMLQDVTRRLSDDQRLQELEPWAPGDKSRWLALDLGDVTGRWVEGPLRPRSDHDDRGYL